MINDSKEYYRSEYYDNIKVEEPKEYFVKVSDEIAKDFDANKIKLLDIGGASGDFLHYFSSRFPDSKLTLLEHDPVLVELAKEKIKNCDVIQGDAHTASDSGEYDVITMLGVHTCFDDIEKLFDAMFDAAKKNATVIVFGMFNDHPIDALVTYRYPDQEIYQKGYNLFSTETVSKYLNRRDDISEFNFSNWMTSIDIEKTDDVVRSWTDTKKDGTRYFLNGFMNIPIFQLKIKMKG